MPDPRRVLVLDADAAAIVHELRRRIPAACGLEAATSVDAVRDGHEVDVCLGRPDLVAAAADRLPALAWVQSTWAGVRPLLPLMADRPELLVTAAKDIFGDAISEYVLGWLLALGRRVLDYDAQQRTGRWAPLPERGLAGRRACVLGTGSIGARVGERLATFGTEVVGVSRGGRQRPPFARVWSAGESGSAVRHADILVCTLPDTEAARGLVDRELLAGLASGAVLVNVGRGAALDEGAVLDALADGRLGAAVLDVFDTEPLPADHPFWRTPNVHVTPHVAGPTAARDIARLFAANLTEWLAGRPPRGAVDSARGY